MTLCYMYLLLQYTQHIIAPHKCLAQQLIQQIQYNNSLDFRIVFYFLADIRRHAFQRHDGAGPRLLRDTRLRGRHDVHDDAALQHLGQSRFDPKRAGRGRGSVLSLHDGLHTYDPPLFARDRILVYGGNGFNKAMRRGISAPASKARITGKPTVWGRRSRGQPARCLRPPRA